MTNEQATPQMTNDKKLTSHQNQRCVNYKIYQQANKKHWLGDGSTKYFLISDKYQ